MRSFRKDTRGVVLIYISVMLPVIIGFATLAVDASRLFILQSSMQNAADALAIAGAAELNRLGDSEARAITAMQTLVNNEKKFASGSLAINVAASGRVSAASSDLDWRFLSSIPNSDDDPITSEFVSAIPETTSFIEVTVKPTAFSTIFPVSFFNAIAPGSITATAVAGFTVIACKSAPVFICNPYEAAGITTVDGLKTKVGDWINIRQMGAGSTNPGPGNYNFVSPNSTSNGTCDLSSATPRLNQIFAGGTQQSCEVSTGICPLPGAKVSLDAALNTRFDIYEGNYNTFTATEAATIYPAQSFAWTKDQVAGCTQDTFVKARSTDPGKLNAVWFPRGNPWSASTYYAAAHNGASLPTGADRNGDGIVTRHEVYLTEVDENVSKPATGETCFSSRSKALIAGFDPAPYLNAKADRTTRRDLFATLVNCNAISSDVDSPYNLNGASNIPLPVLAYAQFFITEPVNKAIDTSSAVLKGNSASYPRTLNGTPTAEKAYLLLNPIKSPGTAGQIYIEEKLVLASALADANGNGLRDDLALAYNASFALKTSLTNLGLKLCIESGRLKIQYYNAAMNGNLPLPAGYFTNTTCGTTTAYTTLPTGAPEGETSIYSLDPDGNKSLNLELVSITDASDGSAISTDVVRLYR